MSRLRRFAVGVLGYNVAVTIWGAFVRATGSGAGCGAHWPLCNGVVVPRSPTLATVIELTHRVTSGLAVVSVAALVAWSFRALPRRHQARRAAVAAAAFIALEALVGAALVTFGWVARDDSAARAGVMIVHLVNTFLLLGAIALTAALVDEPTGLGLRQRGALAAALGLGLATVLVSGATGAMAALGDTLFPARSVAQGVLQELQGDAPFVLRLRLVHPFASLASALVLSVLARAVLQARDPRLRPYAFWLLVLLGVHVLGGALNLVLLAPVWLQLVHLALADLTWIALVLLCAAALAPAAEVRSGPSAPAAATPP